MKKIININFHSRVVPIEETAYEILQEYIESLRRYFANEEGRDEIISDIENRFAELFSESLKKGAACITDADVSAIIASMGRPEDFEEEEGTTTGASGRTAGPGTAGTTGGNTGAGAGAGAGAGGGYQGGYYQYNPEEPRRLYRSENDKILGGVCAGLANYLRLDPALLRIIFVLISFGGGLGILLYIVLWIVLPYKSLPVNIRKRLYRNPDDKVIAGVASGLASYFHIDVWIPRLIFALPLILGIITSVFHTFWFNFHGRYFFTGGFGGTLFVTYIVLWIVLPEAVTASEKLEMRGEKVDLESIKNTIKSDLGNFNKKAREVGAEMKESFQKAGERVKQSTQSFAAEAYPAARRTTNGFGHAVGVLFKAFFLFIAGLIAFSLIMALAALAFRGDGVLDLKNYILAGFWQNFLAWAGFVLFLVIPVVALLTWLIRRITGVRSRNHYLGYTFGTLWVIGLFSLIVLAGMIMSNFRSRQHVEEEIQIVQPAHGKLVVMAAKGDNRFYDNEWWFDGNWHGNSPFYNMNDDSLGLTTVRVNLLKSEDSSYHVQLIRLSRGNNARIAHDLAQQIVFPIRQTDSILYLPRGFAITQEQKWRNQQVLVTVAIPIGRKIVVNSSVRDYKWFSINANGRHIRWNNNWDDNWAHDDDDDFDMIDNSYSWAGNIEYVMTTTGLVRADRKEKDRVREDRNRNNDNNNDDDQPEYKSPDAKPVPPAGPSNPDKGGYRYKSPERPKTKPAVDTPAAKNSTMLMATEESLLSALFQ
ncbi:MAG TPA: PspC domain-containing protein [Puia sp.]|jgi:phage shock protein PspC (stress-responsive transcriptional regulator)